MSEDEESLKSRHHVPRKREPLVSRDAISSRGYSYLTWKEKYPSLDVDVRELELDPQWKKVIMSKDIRPEILRVNQFLVKCLTKGVRLYPYPDLLFNGFNLTPFKDVKVVIVGQDPYPNSEIFGGALIPCPHRIENTVVTEQRISQSPKVQAYLQKAKTWRPDPLGQARGAVTQLKPNSSGGISKHSQNVVVGDH